MVNMAVTTKRTMIRSMGTGVIMDVIGQAEDIIVPRTFANCQSLLLPYRRESDRPPSVIVIGS